MWIIMSEILLVFGAIYFCLILLVVRNPQNKDKWLTKPWMIESVHLLAILGSWVIGTGFLIEGLLRIDTTTELGLHAVVFLVLAACTVLVIKKMRLKQRLSEFAAKKAAGADVVAMPVATNGAGDPPSPVLKAA